MNLQAVGSSRTASWTVHDCWSQTYVGMRRVTYDLLPMSGAKLSSEDGALCQLALVGANHLMEIALYRLLLPCAESTGQISSLAQALLEDASYYQMMTRWVPAVYGRPLDLNVQPFLSTERLRRRRNQVIHKSSAPTTVAMARSALHSAVEGTRALHAHAGAEFPYEPFLRKYPVGQEMWFSEVSFLEGT